MEAALPQVFRDKSVRARAVLVCVYGRRFAQQQVAGIYRPESTNGEPKGGKRIGKMKTLIALVLLFLTTATAVTLASTDLAVVTSVAITQARAAEPAQLLLCGATLLALSVAVRRASLTMPKR